MFVCGSSETFRIIGVLSHSLVVLSEIIFLLFLAYVRMYIVT